MLDERQLAGSQRRECGLIEIINVDRQPCLGKGGHKRDADVASAAHDSHISSLRAGRTGRCRFGRCDIQLVPLSSERANIVANCRGPASHPPNGLIGPFSNYLASKFRRTGNNQFKRAGPA
jgi:hypothetical protein